MLKNASTVTPIKISKTIKLPTLLDVEEMENLLHELPGALFYLVQGICKKGEGILSQIEFVEIYGLYIASLKNGEKPSQSIFRGPFSSALSVSSDALVSLAVDENSQLIRAIEPIIQLQRSQITYAEEEGTFRSQQFGEGAIEWGVQFSYPQIYQDPNTNEIGSVDGRFPNTAPFRALQKWVRYNTVATPFVVNGRRINATIRLGKKCFSWIQSHPQLKERGILIHGAC